MILWYVLIVTSSYVTELGPYPSPQMCGQVGDAVNKGLQEPPRSVLATVMSVPKVVFGMQPAEPKHERPSVES